MRKLVLLVVVAFSTAALAASTAVAAPTVVYDAALPHSGNLPSVGGEAYAFNEFGDEITFAPDTGRKLAVVKVSLSSWGCQQGTWFNKDCVTAAGSTFQVPVTLNIYNVASTDPTSAPLGAGALIQSVTQTVDVPYRPSASPKCTGDQAGKWYHHGTCLNGKSVTIKFKFQKSGIQLPDSVVLGVAYDTTHYGYNPIGESAPCFGTGAGCPYDSLNIGLSPAVTTGSKPYPDTVFQNAAASGLYCDATPTAGTFNLDSPTSACWAGLVPAFTVTANG
jgi:hypothetical protein